MKTAGAIVMSLLLMGALGCTSSRGGGLAASEGFTISIPTFTTTVVQGETHSVIIALNRREYFKQDVKLAVKASEGISVAPAQTVVKASAVPDVQLRVTAAKDAALGEYKIYLTGTPENGEAVTTDFTVKVVSP
jgi:uncharacterized membrane protein